MTDAAVSKRRLRAASVAYWAGGFVLPILVLCALAAAGGVYPFGPASFLADDLQYQYVDFYSWYQRVLGGEEALLYTSSQALGSNAWGLFSYYLSSPFNLLLPLFGDSYTLFAFVACALRLGAMQVAMMFYLHRRFPGVRALGLPLALCYTLSLWSVTNLRNPMWLDGLVFLPLAMLGAWRCVRKGKWGLLLGAVAAAVVANWYSAYMLVAFTVLYALLECVCARLDVPGFDARRFAKTLATGAAALVGALALAGWIFLPTVFSLVGDVSEDVTPQAPGTLPPVAAAPASGEGAGADAVPDAAGLGAAVQPDAAGSGAAAQPDAAAPDADASPGLLDRLYDAYARNAYPLSDCVRGLASGGFVLEATPQLFSGTVLVVGFFLFMTSRRVPWALKAAVCVGVVFLFASVWIKPLYHVWCGLRAPRGFYCRNAQFFGVLLVWATACAIDRTAKGRFGRTSVALSVALPAAGLAAAALAGMVASWWCLVASALVLAVCGVFFGFAYGNPDAGPVFCRAAFAALVASVLLEAGANANLAWGQIYGAYQQGPHDAYAAESRSQAAALQAYDPSDFRFAKTYTRILQAALNEGMASGYDEISSYSSAHNGYAIRFLNGIGYSAEGYISTRYAAPQLFMDSLLDVKYVDTPLAAPGLDPVSDVPAIEGSRLYRNPWALPLGYAVSDDVRSFALDTPQNVFERQNALASALLGRDVAVFVPCEARVAQDGRAQGGPVRYEVDVPAGAIGYYAVVGTDKEPCFVAVEGGAAMKQAYRFQQAVTPLGPLVDDAVTYQVTLGDVADESLPPYEIVLDAGHSVNAAPKNDTSCVFYALDMEAFQQVIEDLRAGGAVVESHEDTSVRATVDAGADGELVMFTIPFDAGWSARVNGAPAQVVPLAESAFLGVEVPPGRSTVELAYVSPGLALGCATTGVAAAVLLALAIRRRLRASRGGVGAHLPVRGKHARASH
ncbi:YfhO family protein [Xiamenia xianingshaonis]|uniref:YfhO family protein n=1 Tax=Xiamenia xianingshaonis TaxID=2682776 RepID=A0A9E6MPD0_9ACTN|nr:YfhO family protein [Xiamenia xianingshaonis]NHM14529.1 YfhO family protein [Xiamenia xianingshaonis]QTU83816.1 YfhO family protein [Xiamenia xianingshaonis]